MLIGARTAEWGGKVLPYDREVSYLRSHGNEYIDTMVIARSGITTELVGSIIDGNQNDGYYLLGARTPNRFFAFAAYTGKFNVGLKNDNLTLNCLLDIKYRIKLETNSYGWSFYLNDEFVQRNNDVVSDCGKLFMFCRSRDGNPNAFTKGKVFSCLICENGNVIRDFVPVVKNIDGIDVGFMYDRCGSICPLTGTPLYANAGTGAFTWGELNASAGGGVGIS